jgi:hypothetical protein
MNNQHLIIALVLFFASTSSNLISNFVMFAIIGEVNRKLPDEERIPYLWWHLGKYQRTLREYRRLYPGGRLVMYHFGSLALGMLLLAAFAWEVGFFR